MIDKYYTVPEVAEILKVSDESVRRYIKKKKLTASKITLVGLKKVWGVLKEDIDKFKNM
jgi:excisionase family DNA binding protein